MKKIKIGLPILALVLAIAASAFTQIPKEEVKANDEPLFWYVYDAVNDELVSQIGSGQITREEAESPGCDLTTGTECARAYETEQTGLPIENPDPGVDALHKNN